MSQNQTHGANLKTTYVAKGGRNAEAIPWADVAKMVLGLIQCASPIVAKRWARNHPEACLEMIDQKFRDERTFATANDRKTAVDAAYETFLKTPNGELRRA